MKQHIDSNQLVELSNKAKKKLREWWKPTEGDFYYTQYEDSKFYGQLDSSYEAESAKPDKVSFEGTAGEGSEKDLPLLSIGQLIEFLDEHTLKMMMSNESSTNKDGWAVAFNKARGGWQSKELIDVLWRAVTEILENQDV